MSTLNARESDEPEVRTRSRLLRRVTLSLVETPEDADGGGDAAVPAGGSDEDARGAEPRGAERRRGRESR